MNCCGDGVVAELAEYRTIKCTDQCLGALCTDDEEAFIDEKVGNAGYAAMPYLRFLRKHRAAR